MRQRRSLLWIGVLDKERVSLETAAIRQQSLFRSRRRSRRAINASCTPGDDAKSRRLLVDANSWRYCRIRANTSRRLAHFGSWNDESNTIS